VSPGARGHPRERRLGLLEAGLLDDSRAQLVQACADVTANIVVPEGSYSRQKGGDMVSDLLTDIGTGELFSGPA
jgi:hypothetical protein